MQMNGSTTSNWLAVAGQAVRKSRLSTSVGMWWRFKRVRWVKSFEMVARSRGTFRQDPRTRSERCNEGQNQDLDCKVWANGGELTAGEYGGFASCATRCDGGGCRRAELCMIDYEISQGRSRTAGLTSATGGSGSQGVGRIHERR